ncbi:hypothetical protein D9758_016019 [Tetrapyrgos nigripes]|uniref:F-box domain-containing protein n=1 Tax=Tetrapyrgos nigripes TaxID=182062 RepID=A0A8H5CKF0_9AGAR|nr:hypothetical protein D9758_016019 [Tetrapyrgos nigripes]
MISCSESTTSQNATSLPPIQSLPAEILDDLFCICCDLSLPIGFDFSSTYRQLSPSSDSSESIQLTALALNHVCTRWRDITLANPKLWSRVEIRGLLEKLTNDNVDSILLLTKLYLDRSEQRELDIVVEFWDTFYAEDEPLEISEALYSQARTFLPVYKAFFDEAHRWRNVFICVCREIFGPNHYDTWPERLPILRHLSIHVYGQSHDVSRLTPPWLTIIDAPFLDTLIHTGHRLCIGSGTSTDPPLSLPGLTSFQFTGSLNNSNLRLASPKTCLTLRNISGFAGSGPITCLANALHIVAPPETTYYEWSLSNTFDFLKLPNLSQFSIVSPHPTKTGREAFPVEELKSFLLRSSRVLITHFTMLDLTISDEEVLSILTLLPSLSHLAIGVRTYDVLVGPIFSQTFFRRLTYYSNQQGDVYSNRLAHLVEFHLGWVHLDAIVDDNPKVKIAFLDMVASRSHPVLEGCSPLKHAYLRGYRSAEDSTFTQQLRELLGDAIKIDWMSRADWSGFGEWRIV